MKIPTQKGFSLVEMVIYVAILSIVTFVLINTFISFGDTYRQVRMHRAIDNSAYVSLERMTRDIRNATNIVVNQSTFGVSAGVLVLNTANALTSTTTSFYVDYVDSGVLKVDVNGTYSGPLTLAQVTVTNLVFNRLVSTSSEAVKVDMTLEYEYGSDIITKTYNTTVILKGI